MNEITRNIIHNEDCITGLKKLPSNCIDMVLTSPPYDNLRKYNGYVFDFKNTAEELYRVVKSGAVIVWIVNDATIKGSETGTSFKQALYFKEIGFNLHDTMIFRKKNPVPLNCSNRYQPSFEYMFIFSKGKPATFNPIKEDKKYMVNSKNKKFNRKSDGTYVVKEYKAISTKKVIANVWDYNVGSSCSKEKIAFEHPAIFPEKLAQDHILSWSNPGDIILDPFMGSGTTAKMAILNNRYYIGFEISKEYCNLAINRLSRLVS